MLLFKHKKVSTVLQTKTKKKKKKKFHNHTKSFFMIIQFLSFILGILMTYLYGALVLASSICWLMSQLASIMFFLLHLLIITLTFCPYEPPLMIFYFVQHDRLLTQTQSV